MKNYKEFCTNLEAKIQNTYENQITVSEAEKLAAEFLHAQLVISSELTKADLDSRMRKTGLKAIRAAVYLSEVQKSDKKPSDTLLEQTVVVHEEVNKQQNEFDTAEAQCAQLERYYNIFREAHIFFRGVAKGNFN